MLDQRVDVSLHLHSLTRRTVGTLRSKMCKNENEAAAQLQGETRHVDVTYVRNGRGSASKDRDSSRCRRRFGLCGVVAPDVGIKQPPRQTCATSEDHTWKSHFYDGDDEKMTVLERAPVLL
ncbi:unnamed protein product [Caenorhabditis auriculariae]|uniref:Uncharacterized protein n=1 Tax=Caenorhabditis auriculariae TaxID=2777116 RepID=A0A8S1HH58_9PELO|nr:unnamed protein product [Caenorhabditis auriculariae]